MKKLSTIEIKPIEVRIKRKLRKHFRELGFTKKSDGTFSPPDTNKNTYRLLHKAQRLEKLKNNSEFIKAKLHYVDKYFASGCDIDPRKIKPRLQLISRNTPESEIFRLAGLTWSIPVSEGYGRRLRFLVWDDNNDKLIGLFALGDPVFNLRVRDEKIGWSLKQRKERLVNVMDAYVLGSVPPYNMLLGGKLVACLIRTQEVSNAFRIKYGESRGIISGKKKNAQLSIVTTSSALGRSSVYNRLKLDGDKYFQSIGFSSGWGNFHIPDNLFNEMRQFLMQSNHSYFKNYEYGSGPNWKLRTIKAAVGQLGMNPNLMKHGILREIFYCKFAANAENYLKGNVKRLYRANLLSVDDVSSLALDRWIIPRAIRRPNYEEYNKSEIKESLDIRNLKLSRQDKTLKMNKS